MNFPLLMALGLVGSTDTVPASAKIRPMDQAVTTRQVSIDLKATSGPLNTAFRHSVGAGRANEGLRADWQRQLIEAKNACGFEYIRMHGLLEDDMGVYREENGKPVYNFQYIDELYDFLISIRVRPFVEFGFMPGALASGDKTIFWWRGNVTPPKDYEKWAGLIEALVQHWTDRYGKKEVSQWIFEVWNEPNLDGFWAGDMKEYFKLYAATAHAVKKVSPNYRVGGPATAGNGWIQETIDFCEETKTPLDFLSTHTYGVDVGFLDEFGGRGTASSKNPDSVSGDVKRVREQIRSSSMPSLPLFYTEWSSSYTPADPLHDSYFSAPYIIEKLNDSMGFAESMSYWTFTDIFEEAGPRMTPFHGGFGMINYQGIKKPSFRAYELLNKLGSEKLKVDAPRTIATKSKDGSVQALFWDFSNTLPAETNNQAYYITDIKPKQKQDVKLEINGLKPGRYQLSIYQVGYRVNDPYAEYLELGRPNKLTRDQVAKIKDRCNGAPVKTEIVTVGKGKPISQEFKLRENDVYLVDMKPI